MAEPTRPLSENSRTLLFMGALSLFCALVLSLLASALAKPKELAKELDRSKEMMIAAKILSHEGYFLVKNGEGQEVKAKFQQGGLLVADPDAPLAASGQIIQVYTKRLLPYLVNDKGEMKSFQELNIDPVQYLADFKKTGYFREPWKLIYVIKANDPKITAPEGYVIPVNGYGLWDAIYGYLAIKTDGDTVIGISWYEHKETPGLGANISEAAWQRLFPGKKIFQESPNGTTDFQTAPIGITVVKGKVSDIYGDSPKGKSAVDGMTGATLTGNGVTDAYKQVLASYRVFLIKLHKENKK